MKIALLDDYAGSIRQAIPDEELEKLDLTIFRDSAASKDELIERLKPFGAIGLIQQRTFLPADVINNLPNLRMISQTGKNISHIDVEACAQRGIVICGVARGNPTPTAEFTWALLLAALRDIPRQVQRLKDGQWQNSSGVTLEGKTLGIYGFGNIGSTVAKYGKAFDMDVICWGRDTTKEKARAAGFKIADSREAFFSQSDVISLHLTMNGETQGIVTTDDLAAMKPSALLVNTSRAGLINPGVLESALDAGRPGMAAVDVYESEPIFNAQHPLLKRDNALCTPHLGYCVDETYARFLPPVIEHIKAFVDGNPVNVLNTPAASHS